MRGFDFVRGLSERILSREPKYTFSTSLPAVDVGSPTSRTSTADLIHKEKKEKIVQPPDSKYGWVVAFASFLCHFVGLGFMYTFGVFVLPLSQEFGVGRGTISWIGSITAGLNLVFSTFSGMLADRIAYRWVVLAGSACISSGLLISSIVETLWLMYFTYSVVIGLGISLVFVPSLGCVGQWFEKNRGLATGLAVAGSGVGNLALPPIATVLIEKYGWRLTFRILSVIPVLTVLAAFLLRRRVPSTRKWGFDGALKTKEFLLLFISGLFIGYGYLIPFVHMSPFAQDCGIDTVKASLLLSIMGASSFIGRIILGVAADRLQNRLLILRLCYGVMAVITFAWPFLRNFYALIVYGFFFGFFGGGYISMMPAVVAEYFGIAKLSSLVGVMYLSAAIGNVVGPPVTGFIFDATKSYIVGGILAAVTLTIGFIVVLFSPPIPLTVDLADLELEKPADKSEENSKDSKDQKNSK